MLYAALENKTQGAFCLEIQAVVITIAGAVGLITQTVILRLMMRFFGETKTLIFGKSNSL